MRKGKNRLIVLLSLGTGVALGTGWYVRQDPLPERYQTASIKRGPLTRSVTATGTVNPVTTVQVGSDVSGPIKELFVDFNSPVKQGQRVAQIDPRPFLVKVQQAEAGLSTTRAEVDKDQADLTFKQQVRTRLRALRERKLVAQQEVDAAERDYAQAQAQLQLDRARVAQNAAALEEARVNLGYTEITSPVDGVVVSRNVNVGQTVAASFQTPVLFLIAQDLTKMQVNTNISESDIGGLCPGQPASFTVDAYPGQVFPGTVAQVRNAPLTVQNVVTYDVLIAVDNSELELKPGMTATVTITTDQRDNVLRIPLRALRFRPELGAEAVRDTPAESATVWVVEPDGQLQRVAVQTGIQTEQYAEVVAGDLREGDQLAVAVRHGAQPSAKLQPFFSLAGPRGRAK